jgi:glycosyltransferase involved in cell wall biosynthesis
VSRVPHLLHVFPSFIPGGIEMRAVNLIAGFGDELRHSILALDGRTDAAARLPPGAPVRLLPGPPKAGSLRTAARLRELLRSEAPDLVLTYNWAGFDMLLAARAAGFRRLVHHEDGFAADEAHRLKLRRVLARRAVLPAAHRLVVPSERLRDIATRVWKVPDEKVRLIVNGLRLDSFRPADGNPGLRRELGIPPDALVVGSVGRLSPEKSFARLLEACAALPSGVHLLIVGEGDERPALEARASRPDLAGRVHLPGYQSDPPRFYRAMDLFALSSDTEQMPVCLLEAMATRLPVAATDVGDLRSVLPPEQHPHLVPLAGERTAGTLADRLRRLLADRAERERLGRLNRRRVEERYTFEGMLEAYREVYHGALTA